MVVRNEIDIDRGKRGSPGSPIHLLGARLVAYLGLVKETRAVRQWADAADPRKPSALVENRLRAAYQIAGTLREADSAAVVQALREGDPEESGPRVLAAARAFASSSAA